MRRNPYKLHRLRHTRHGLVVLLFGRCSHGYRGIALGPTTIIGSSPATAAKLNDRLPGCAGDGCNAGHSSTWPPWWVAVPGRTFQSTPHRRQPWHVLASPPIRTFTTPDPGEYAARPATPTTSTKKPPNAVAAKPGTAHWAPAADRRRPHPNGHPSSLPTNHAPQHGRRTALRATHATRPLPPPPRVQRHQELLHQRRIHMPHRQPRAPRHGDRHGRQLRPALEDRP
jgi:hypothetical protein